MPIYEYGCLDCGHYTEIFTEIKNRKGSTKCEKCGKIAIRIYTTGGVFLKKVRVEDVWKKAGIEVGEGETLERKQRNSKRIKKMREQNTDNGDKK